MAIEKSFSLQRVEVLHDRGLAGESKMLLDFARARRDPFLALLGLDETEDVLLPLREHGISLISNETRIASSNEHNSTIRLHAFHSSCSLFFLAAAASQRSSDRKTEDKGSAVLLMIRRFARQPTMCFSSRNSTDGFVMQLRERLLHLPRAFRLS